MSIPTDCTNPDCTSRLHFIDDSYALIEWQEALWQETLKEEE